MKTLLIIITLLPLSSFACEFDDNLKDFYKKEFTKNTINKIYQAPKFKNCPTNILELYLENPKFILNIVNELKREFLVSEHLKEHILRPKEQIFPPLLVIKE